MRVIILNQDSSETSVEFSKRVNDKLKVYNVIKIHYQGNLAYSPNSEGFTYNTVLIEYKEANTDE